MRVCFLNRSYWPDTGATGQLLTELAEDLASHHGMEVTVITGRPLAARCTPPPRREVRRGVTILRGAGTTFGPEAFAGRAANYLTYFASACRLARALPPQDVVVAMTDPPIIGLAALAMRGRPPLIFYCQDIFPEVAALLQDFRSGTVDRLLDRVTRYLLRRARHVVALGDTMAHRLAEEKGVSRSKIVVIHNWADTTAITPGPQRNPFSEAHGLAGKFVVLHAGNLGQAQGLETVLDAADRLRVHDDIVFLFIGDGTARRRLEERAAVRGLERVLFLPYQPREQMRWTYATASVFLVSLKPGLAGYIVPSKVYGILAAGRPWIAAVDEESEVAAMTAQHGCGVRVAPGDAAALAEAIVSLRANPAQCAAMGERARAASALFDRARQVAAHAALIRAAGAA
jgi:glycosyltransferase involved in cell wall biosynthesis